MSDFTYSFDLYWGRWEKCYLSNKIFWSLTTPTLSGVIPEIGFTFRVSMDLVIHNCSFPELDVLLTWAEHKGIYYIGLCAIYLHIVMYIWPVGNWKVTMCIDHNLYSCFEKLGILFSHSLLESKKTRPRGRGGGGIWRPHRFSLRENLVTTGRKKKTPNPGFCQGGGTSLCGTPGSSPGG